MRRIFLLCVSIMLMTMGCGKSRSDVQNVFGEDNRERVTNRDYPFSALGKLSNSCTGFLIGRKMMLTAAHCVFDSVTQKPRDNFTRFDLGLLNGQAVASAAPVRAWIGSVQPEEIRSTDWAIVELDAELGASHRFLNLSIVDFEKTLPFAVNLAGYNSDINAGLTASVHWGCAVHRVKDGRLFHDCDSTAGISGSPLFASVDGDWRVVGISVSEFRNGNEPPVKREKWSEDFTNVAVPVHSLLGISKKLLDSVEKGLAAPEFSEAIVVDFKTGSDIADNKPLPEGKPAQTPGNTPPQMPQKPAEPLQSPSAQFSPESVYTFMQMRKPWVLWEQVTGIQNTHRALIVDSSVFMAAASASSDPYLTAVANHFNWKLSESIHAWNSFVHCMSHISPCSFDVHVLYNAYVGLKYAEIDLRNSIMKFPSGVSANLSAQENIALNHMRDFESAMFSP